MRDELLNENLFFGLDHARIKIAHWADDYNELVRTQLWAISPRRLMPLTSPQHAIGCATRTPFRRSHIALAPYFRNARVAAVSFGGHASSNFLQNPLKIKDNSDRILDSLSHVYLSSLQLRGVFGFDAVEQRDCWGFLDNSNIPS
jgi:hypothetical protein